MVYEGGLGTKATPAPIPTEMVYEIKPSDKVPPSTIALDSEKQRRLGWQATPEEEAKKPGEEVAKVSTAQTLDTAGQRRWEWQITPKEEAKGPGGEVAKEIPDEYSFPKKFEKPVVPPPPTPVGEKIDVTLNFQAADIREVIKVLLGDLLKLNYVIDRKVAGIMTLHAVGQFYTEELMDIAQTTLNVNGFAVIVKENIAEVVTIQEARQRSPGVYIGGDIQARGEDIITQIVPLKYIVPQGIIPTLRGFMSRAGFVVAPNDAHAIVISEQASNMERLISIIKMFDVPIFAGKALKFYNIKHVDVKGLAKELGDMVRSLGAVTKGTRAEISFTPFVESNRLLVATKNPELLSSIDFWIQNVDLESEERVTRLYIYKVQHQKATDIQPILMELYSEKISGQAAGSGAPRPPSDGRKRGERVEKTKAGAVITEQPMRIIADEGTNSLIIKAVPSDYQEIRSIIEALDAPPQQVLIEIIIAEVTLTKSMDEGVEMFLRNKIKLDSAGETVESGRAIGITNPAGISSGLLVNAFFGDVQTIFKILATESSLNFLSTPHILVRDDQQAAIQVGEDVPTSTGSAIPGGSDIIVSAIEYRSVGIIFTVTPHIAENGMVTLDITEEASEIGPDVLAGGQLNPSFTTRKAETSLVVKGGNTVLIGGIIQEVQRNDVSKVPILGDIPLLGYLFKSISKATVKTELLVLITPHIINTASEAETVTNAFEERVKSLQRLIKGTTIGMKDYIEYEEG
jgi:type II secretion system protein D